jgi:hypothetical protein
MDDHRRSRTPIDFPAVEAQNDSQAKTAMDLYSEGIRPLLPYSTPTQREELLRLCALVDGRGFREEPQEDTSPTRLLKVSEATWCECQILRKEVDAVVEFVAPPFAPYFDPLFTQALGVINRRQREKYFSNRELFDITLRLLDAVDREFDSLHSLGGKGRGAPQLMAAFDALSRVADLYRMATPLEEGLARIRVLAKRSTIERMLEAVVDSGDLELLSQLPGRPVWLGRAASRAASRCDHPALELLLSLPEAEAEIDPECASGIVGSLACWASMIPALVEGSAMHARACLPEAAPPPPAGVEDALRRALRALDPTAINYLREQGADRLSVKVEDADPLSNYYRAVATAPGFEGLPYADRIGWRRRLPLRPGNDEPLEPLTGVDQALLELFLGLDERAREWFPARRDASMAVYLGGLAGLAFAPPLRAALGSLPEGRLALLREWGGARRRWTPLRAAWVGAVAAEAAEALASAEAALAAALLGE